MFTISINGIQVDIQAAIIISSTGQQLSFQHIYFARANPIGDEGVNITTSCSKNPCQNSGFCIVVTKTDYKCLCTAGWEGQNCNISVSVPECPLCAIGITGIPRK
jgi:hypothetical protein